MSEATPCCAWCQQPLPLPLSPGQRAAQTRQQPLYHAGACRAASVRARSLKSWRASVPTLYAPARWQHGEPSLAYEDGSTNDPLDNGNPCPCEGCQIAAMRRCTCSAASGRCEACQQWGEALEPAPTRQAAVRRNASPQQKRLRQQARDLAPGSRAWRETQRELIRLRYTSQDGQLQEKHTHG